MLDWDAIRQLPLVMKIALGAMLALLGLNALILGGLTLSSSSKIDPGLATLCGAIIGLSVIGWQARLGFQNLIKSQENQARLERKARLHQAEIEENARIAEERRKRTYLLSALRSEIVYLHREARDAETLSAAMVPIYEDYARKGAGNVTGPIPLKSFDAPIYRASITNLGLLGVSLGSDVVAVLSYADGKSKDFKPNQSMTNDFIATLYKGNAQLLKHWRQDLYHVAMRIRAVEEGTPDPGTLISTERERRKEN